MKLSNNQNKNGMVLPIIAVGILVVAGLTPFLISNSEVNALVTKSIDDTNKQTWALESAVEDRLKESTNNIPGLKTIANNESEEQEVMFKYENKADVNASPNLEAKIAVKEYNTYLNKNSYYHAYIKNQENYNLNQLNSTEVKPGVSVVNNTTYVWDKYGKLYEIVNKKLVQRLVIDNKGKTQKVWQVVSDGNNPVVVTASSSLSAINVNDKSSYGTGFYKFAAKSEAFQAGIKQAENANLVIPTNTSAANNFNTAHPNAKIEDVVVSENHGLAIVYDKDAEGKDSWQLWGWGNNSNGQVNCLDKDTTIYDDKLVDLSKNYSESNSLYSSVNLTEYVPLEIESNINAISSYLNNNYKFVKKVDGYYIKDSVTGNEIKHEPNNKNNFDCPCPLCQDIADCQQGKPSDDEEITFELSEPQQFKHLELLVDGGSKSNFAKQYNHNKETTVLKCIITNKDDSDEPPIEVEGGIVDPTNIYEAYGDNIWTVKWDEEHLKDPVTNDFYTLSTGTYSIVFQVRYKKDHNNENDWKDMKDNGLFWGWIDRPNGVNNLNHHSDDIYGGIFRLNNNLYNLRDRASEKGDDVNYYAVSTGKNFSLALVSPKDWTSESGIPEFSVIGWGDATLGQLGNGIGSSSVKMAKIATYPVNFDIKDYRDMKSGENHTLFLTKDGKVYSWGGAEDENIYEIHKVLFKNNPKIVYVAAGNNKSAAIDEDGRIYEWSLIEGKKNSIVNPISDETCRLFSVK